MHFIICFFNDTATTEIYTLSLHDALPISCGGQQTAPGRAPCGWLFRKRSEEHTSELQSLRHLVCRLLLEKKKTRACLGTARLSSCRRTVAGGVGPLRGVRQSGRRPDLHGARFFF